MICILPNKLSRREQVVTSRKDFTSSRFNRGEIGRNKEGRGMEKCITSLNSKADKREYMYDGTVDMSIRLVEFFTVSSSLSQTCKHGINSILVQDQ